MLTAREKYEFDVRGYCIVRGAFERGFVERVTEALKRFEGKRQEELPAWTIASWTPVIREYRIMNVLECDPVFEELIDAPQMTRWADELVPKPYRLTEAYSITRQSGLGIPLHALPFAEYVQTPKGPVSKFLTAVINLTDVGPEDGPMVIFDGTHKLGVPWPFSKLHPDWPFPDYDVASANEFVRASEGLEPVRWEEIPGYTEIWVEAGDLVLFSQNLWHGAKELRSGRVRRTLYYSYSPYHFCNWHGVTYSDELKARVTPARRKLLAGPFVGNVYGSVAQPMVEPSEEFPPLPNSEIDPATFAQSADAAASNGGAPADGTVGRELERLFAGAATDGAGARGLCHFAIEGAGDWLVDLRAGPARVFPGASDDAECRIEMAADDFLRMARGEEEPVELFYRGRLRARGDVSLAMRVADLWGG